MTVVLPAHGPHPVGLDVGPGGARSVEPSPRAEAERAAWLFTLAVDLVSDGVEVDAAVRAVFGQAGATGDARALAGAYGRAVAFSAQNPDNRAARQTVQVLAKALGWHHRHRALTPPA